MVRRCFSSSLRQILLNHDTGKQLSQHRRLLQIHLGAAQLAAADGDAGEFAVREVHAGEQGLKQLRPREQAT